LSFHDYFSALAFGYARFRPRYPRGLFEFLATAAPRSERAWDGATGAGQAAVALAEFFDEVVAGDASAQQIANAEKHPRVAYFVATSEQTPLADRSIDLVTIAQALHWLDAGRFWSEVRRVARPRGIVAAWGYGLVGVSPEVDQVIGHLYRDVLGAYWPPERRLVETGYATIEFPFRELAAPKFEIAARWNLRELVGYLGTWSSVQKYVEQNGASPLAAIEAELAAAWGAPETVRPVRWPLFLRAGRVE
jgi:SAM-dependent methyltransferase